MAKRRWLWAALIGALLMMWGSVSAQESGEPINLQVEAGYDGFFRTDAWIPLRIQVRNDGASVAGRLTVRPETSGRAVNTTFSTPIDLPTGSEKTAFLYIQANANATAIVVELLTADGVRVTETAVVLRAIDGRDALHVVLSGTGANSIALNGVATGGYSPRAARWQPENVPPASAALRAIDTLIVYDVDSDTLSVDQRTALAEYVTFGGHLIVIGGPAWAQTTAAFEDLLPLTPSGSTNLGDLAGLAAYAGFAGDLDGRTPAVTGDVVEDARVLAATGDDVPLLVRHNIGAGTVDLLAVDPTLEPLRGWQYLPELWLRMMTTTTPQTGWQRGFLDTQETARALAILPGVNLLPPVSNMIAFIAAYIFLIGPINYWVLSRFNRRAWAWLTIPLVIAVFSGLAWTVGFNLRGSEVIASRLYVTQVYPDEEIALQQQLVGILSPRREIYDLNAPDSTLLRVLPGLNEDTLFQPTITRSTAEIVQSGSFNVEDIAIDGGIFANFELISAVAAPQISGSATISYDTDDEITTQTIRGVVRNDSDITLEDAVILSRNGFYRLSGNVEAGDVIDFDSGDFTPILVDEDNILPQVNAFAMPHNLQLGTSSLRNTFATADSLVTSRVVLGIPWNNRAERRDDLRFDTGEPTETDSRRRAFLRAFMRDQFSGTGIGNEVYLIGWSEAQREDDITLANTPYRPVDTSLYIIGLATTVEPAPSSETVTLSPDQFTWHILAQESGQVLGALDDLTIINPGFIEFQLTPIEGAVLDEVNAMQLVLDRSSSYGREVEAFIWHWDDQQWAQLNNNSFEIYDIENPAEFTGPDNAVRVRLVLDRDLASSAASARIRGLRVIQTGQFE